MFDFLQVKKVVSEFGDRVRTTKADLEALKQERDLIATAPTSKADAIRALHARLDSEAEKYRRIFTEALTPLIVKADPARVDMPVLGACKSGQAPTFASFEGALALALNDHMKAAAARIIEGMEWPANALDQAEREKRLALLDDKISGAENELSDLLRSARAAGLNI